MTNPQGMSLHIGVNDLNPAGYPLDPHDDEWPEGWDGPLKGCHTDAESMCAIARERGFETKILLSEEATADNVKAEIRKAAAGLSAGDTFLITFAGHGGQVPDITGDEAESGDEFDAWDETWCLYDRHFIDDEQLVLYSEFKPGVRIVVFSDSCHSGTVMRSANTLDDKPVSRTMPRGTVHACYHARKKEYDALQKNLRKVRPDEISADTLLISACQENEIAGDGSPNGAFTSAVLRVWDNGKFDGSYKGFHEQVVADLQRAYEEANEEFSRGNTENEPIHQTPNIDTMVAKRNIDATRRTNILDERPFSI